MKRSSALAPLSRDHHVALVVARDLFRASEDDARAVAERFVRFLAGHELAHFALEERMLLPAMPAEPRARQLQEQVRADHEDLRAALRQLQEARNAPSVGFLHDIGRRLRAHVQVEEREVFPYIERTLDPAALERLGARLAREHDHASRSAAPGTSRPGPGYGHRQPPEEPSNE
jgi:hemerythrin-like domain-containing protein